jgi:hypothetical protein
VNAATNHPVTRYRLETVRCLQCGSTYEKPVDAGVRDGNPGCPVCEYLGWIKVSAGVTGRAIEPSRSGGDLRPHRLGRSR